MKEGYGNWVFPWGGFCIEQVGFVFFFVSTGRKGPKDAGRITRRKGLKTLEREGKLMVQHIFDLERYERGWVKKCKRKN